MCMIEFGIQLEKLRHRIETLCEGQESAFRCFCEDLRTTPDTARRRKIVIDFVTQVATSAKFFAEEATRQLVGVQAFCIDKMSSDFETMLRDVTTAFNTESEQIKDELEVCNSTRSQAEEEARDKFEKEKAAIETSLRDELVSCRICMLNPRSIMIMPCMHAQFCAECVEQSIRRNGDKCPSCRGTIVSKFPYVC
ncbi:hypothetical protein KP509_30G039800 [Ceratopteris richardii]|nr:hypothetical protein KP509_30G039800 [Ceratopteris richardii]